MVRPPRYDDCEMKHVPSRTLSSLAIRGKTGLVEGTLEVVVTIREASHSDRESAYRRKLTPASLTNGQAE